MNKNFIAPKNHFSVSLYENLLSSVKKAKDSGLTILVPTDTDHENFEAVADNLDNFFTQPALGDNHTLCLVVSKGEKVFDLSNNAKCIYFKCFGNNYYQVDVDSSTLFASTKDRETADMFSNLLNDEDKKYLYEPEEDEGDEDEDEEEEYNYLDDI